MRTLCTTCKAPVKPDQESLDRLGFSVDPDEVELFYGKGCENCTGTGYQGRQGVYELMMTTDNVRTLIMQGSSSARLRREAREEGMHTLREDAWLKAIRGVTTLEEVLRVTHQDEPLKK